MFSKIKTKFQQTPTLYYAMSVAASWAGVGSLMNSVTMTQDYGIVPSIIWSLGNSVACIVFGLVACKLTQLREIMRTRVVKYIIGIISIFQLWTNMNGIREIFDGTAIGMTGGTIIAYVVCIAFILLLLRFGMIRNVLTDSGTWIAAYVLVFCVVIAAFYFGGGPSAEGIGMGLEWSNLSVGIQKGLLLLPGPFTFPYFYAMLDYNDQNQDGTKKANIQRSFVLGGTMFGVYMLFTFAIAFAQFGPVLNMMKAILVSIIAISSISTFIYSEYLVFGRKVGLAIDGFTVIFWPLLMGLGVMGVWTLMANIRVYLVIVLLIIALVRHVMASRKAVI